MHVLEQHRPIVVAMLAAIILHGVALYWLRWDRSMTPSSPRTLEVLLRTPPSTLPAVMPEPAETTRELKVEQAAIAEPPLALTEEPAEAAFVPPSPQSIRAFIQSRPGMVEEPGYRTFSTDDFPRAENRADPFSRAPTLKRSYVHRAEVKEYTDAEGNLVVRRVDAWGRVTCARQIHFPGDGNGPQWYVFPPGTSC